MTLTFHAWTLLPLALSGLGIVAIFRTEAPSDYAGDLVHPLLAFACFVGAAAAVLGHYL